MSWAEHGLTNYPSYFHTKWWMDLKREHIDNNKASECYVCGRASTLLIHHISYRALYKEKLHRDIVILCYNCHTLTHFWFYKLIKVPLTTNALLFSMRLRKSFWCLKNHYFIMFFLWLLLAFIIGSYYFSIWLIVGLIKGLWKLKA